MILPLFDSHGNFKMINLSEEVLYLQTNGYGRLQFYTERSEYTAAQSVGEWADVLRGERFLRIDRGTIVNLNKISGFDSLLRVIEMRTANGGFVAIPVAEPMMKRLKMELEG